MQGYKINCSRIPSLELSRVKFNNKVKQEKQGKQGNSAWFELPVFEFFFTLKSTKITSVTGSSSFVHFPGPVSLAPTTIYQVNHKIVINNGIDQFENISEKLASLE